MTEHASQAPDPSPPTKDCCANGGARPGPAAACPHCGVAGRAVSPVTIESLVRPEALRHSDDHDGFHFCAQPDCPVAYYQPRTGASFDKAEVRVRIGQKETTAPRPVCYCFEHTAEEIEAQVAATGNSTIPEQIAARCKQGLDHCEDSNPQGHCCLGNVRKVLQAAQEAGSRTEHPVLVPGHGPPAAAAGRIAGVPTSAATSHSPRQRSWVSLGAVLAAVVASACCWLPLLLVALGFSGGAIAVRFEAWRPVFLPLALVLLAWAWVLTLRQPVRAAAVAAPGGERTPGGIATAQDDCCAPTTNGIEDCCAASPANPTRGLGLRRLNRVSLSAVTVLVLAFAFFPDYLGSLLANQGGLPAGADAGFTGPLLGTRRWTLDLSGMTCEACAAGIEANLSRVPGVSRAAVDFDASQAQVLADDSVDADTLAAAVREAGYEVKATHRGS